MRGVYQLCQRGVAEAVVVGKVLKFVLTSSTVNDKLNKLKTDKVPLLGQDYLSTVCCSCFDQKVNYCNSFKVMVYIFHDNTGISSVFSLRINTAG